ncbi:glycosyltransferase [Lithospermum erythrorhizon]|uniref:Glycosyltransferase n=1 Tax=Lithospermum erythrorhizon TaxID=34254 RepID=A0AAV3RT17_LITER
MPPPLPTTAILLLAAVLLHFPPPSTATNQYSNADKNCTNKWIFIRQLPPRFNTDLLSNCSVYPLFDDFCPYVPNHGLGYKTHNKSQSWFRTDPFMLELIFHRRMLEYSCLTTTPNQANAFYVPYYGGMDSIKYLYGPEVNNSFQHGKDLYNYLSQKNSPAIWNKNLGHDHFMVLSRSAWDLNQPLGNDPLLFGTSFLELPEFYNVTALTLEARAYPWQERALPYPTSFHPPSLSFLKSWINRVKKSKRSTLMLFAGGGRISANPNIRKSIRLECENATQMSADGTGYSNLCEFVDCSNGVCEHDPLKFTKPMLQATFCLQPPGDTPTRRSTFDSIIAGCIPVFFDELTAKKQYGWHFPVDQYHKFTVFIQKEEVVFKGIKILDVLKSIPGNEIRRMRERVIQMMPRVIYRRHGSSLGLKELKDAFDIAVEGTLKRIKSRLKEVAAQ